MARISKGVVQVERLRDQVYALIREDLKTGEFAPGQRLVEVELAEKYGVSRTPVREALFQLTRSGFLDNTERGYSAPTYSKKDIADRLEVKRLLVPRVAEHVAAVATSLQIRRLAKLHELEKSAHAAGNIQRFNEANHGFRTAYCAICDNELLARSLMMVEDHFEIARGRIHHVEKNRRLSIEHDGRLLAAIEAHDVKAAVAEVEDFLEFLAVYYSEHLPGD